LVNYVDDAIPTEDALTVFDVLGEPRRNRAVRVLQVHETPISLDHLASLVESDGSTDTVAGPTPRDERSCRTDLHHNHLPKLDDAGVIRYDSDERVVTELDEERLRSLLTTGKELLRSLDC
jgi:hypothetical protein